MQKPSNFGFRLAKAPILGPFWAEKNGLSDEINPECPGSLETLETLIHGSTSLEWFRLNSLKQKPSNFGFRSAKEPILGTFWTEKNGLSDEINPECPGLLETLEMLVKEPKPPLSILLYYYTTILPSTELANSVLGAGWLQTPTPLLHTRASWPTLC